MTSVRSTAGLEGVIAGQTALSTVGKEGCGLTYRGYAIEDLAEHTCFEEVAWLLLRGELPTRPQLEGYRQRLASLRGLPAPLQTILEQLPPTAHPMDVLRTGCSFLGCLEPEAQPEERARAEAVRAKALACLDVVCQGPTTKLQPVGPFDRLCDLLAPPPRRHRSCAKT